VAATDGRKRAHERFKGGPSMHISSARLLVCLRTETKPRRLLNPNEGWQRGSPRAPEHEFSYRLANISSVQRRCTTHSKGRVTIQKERRPRRSDHALGVLRVVRVLRKVKKIPTRCIIPKHT
jgi:hypothetical protein